MRKLVLAIVVIILGCIVCCRAEDKSERHIAGIYEYRILADGTVEITDTTFIGEDLKIPAIIDSREVTSIGECAFQYCYSIKTVTMPNSVTNIGDYAFYWCDSLVSAKLPENLRYIGDAAFSCCRALKTVDIPDCVVSIGDSAFAYCTSLTSITIPDAITHIGVNPFSSCGKLTTIEVSAGNEKYSTINGVLFDEIEKKLICYPCTNTEKRYSIPKGTISIGEEAFYSCNNLISITIPGGVTDIEKNAFYSCAALMTVNLPNSLMNIGECAFYTCYSLTEIIIPENVTNIGIRAFDSCSKLSVIDVSPKNKVYESIEGVLFSKQDKKLICYPIGHKETQYIVPQGVTAIGEYAFKNCMGLTSVVLVDDIIAIDKNAFEACYELRSITIPSSVKSIGNYAFKECVSLTKIVLPDSIVFIGDYAFERCKTLVSINIPEGVSDIGNNPFRDCKELTRINVSPESMYYATIDGVLFSKKNKELICYPYTNKNKSYEIPYGIISIGDSAFDSNVFYKITIPDTVTNIGKCAFEFCNLITTVEIPDSVTNIGDYAFYDCYALSSVYIPDSVTNIGENAFGSCERVKFTVERDSYAAKWVKIHNKDYCYTDAFDWLNG
ncbi:MAG: leucine-rich repeat domain-containing protein [Clostridia bacterium]|nr:leucine-rich repeat domain-containing protein [Clostridia bacterium]